MKVACPSMKSGHIFKVWYAYVHIAILYFLDLPLYIYLWFKCTPKLFRN